MAAWLEKGAEEASSSFHTYNSGGLSLRRSRFLPNPMNKFQSYCLFNTVKGARENGDFDTVKIYDWAKPIFWHALDEMKRIGGGRDLKV